MNIEPYYFKTQGQEPDGVCLEYCNVLSNGTRIGSVKCQLCQHCIGSDKDKYGEVSWIKCNVIDTATRLIN